MLRKHTPGTLHLLALWAFAVAEPVYEVLRRNREFFVAHRTSPTDLLIFVLTISVLIPMVLGGMVAGVGRFSTRAARGLLLVLVAVLATTLASQVLSKSAGLTTTFHLVLAAFVGALAALCYERLPVVRTFVTALSPALIAFPTIFLLHPSMDAFLHPNDVGPENGVSLHGPRPPIVVVIFDQLPLTSLMSDTGVLDLDRYPGFASLAREATWYRNASTVAELTGWAVPPILTGLRPRPGALPTSAEYPNNLFTMLADTYRFEVEEPITDLCPERLCPEGEVSWGARLMSALVDAGVVYLHVTLPAGLRGQLPSLTQDWKNFLRNQHWQRRWVTERDDDRRVGPREFIAGVSAEDPQPTLYFLHALLPHEPYLFLASGQQFTEDGSMAGLSEGRWVNDEWPVAQAYRRHLVQLSYVDALVGQLVARLKSQGLWDTALIVLTADHGVSFRPGHAFKGVENDTLPDIAAVPLFVKLPGQHTGAVSDRNVQSIDIVPTIADALDADPRWRTDGVSLLADASRPSIKRIQYMGATQTIEIGVDDLARRRDEAVRRKVQWFGSGRVDGIVPIASPHPELLGQSVRAFDADDAEDVTVLVDRPARYLDVDPRAPVIPALVSGVVRDARGRPRDARLAVAVNGVVLATTATYGFPRGRSGAWSALVPPGGFRRGRNELEVFVIDEGEPTRVRRAYALGDPSPTLNLVSRGARTYWAISQDGFYQADEGSTTWYRWTKGGATVTLPFTSSPAPRSLRIGLWAVRPGGTPLRLTVNDCVVFEGHVDKGPWYRTFSLDACGASATAGPDTRIGISSGVFVPGGQDARTLGVAVAVLNLYPDPWPPPASAAGGTKRADLRVVDDGEPIVRGGTVTVALENRGDSIWLGPDAATKEDAFGFEMTWRAAGKNAILAHVNVPIARTFYPDDRERFALPATPLEPLGGTAWDLTIRLVDGQGRPVAMEHSCHVRVRSSAGQS